MTNRNKKNEQIRQIRRRIFLWYNTHRRDLPWRRTRNPYSILVSEIMLQQTQVDRVIPKYRAFLRAFPTVQKLAQAKTSAVIRAWKGLGYNRRALYLQRAAQAVVSEFGGIFPQSVDTLKTLPGVGEYTARAILSFAFEKPVPMMDTNHRRFYQRTLFGLRKKNDQQLLNAAEQLLSTHRAYDWNQALMDFGSQVCVTRRPLCASCPIQQWCRAYPKVLSVSLSRKKKKTTPFKETDRYIRGRILDTLRENHALTTQTLRRRFAEVEISRYQRIIRKMTLEGLIKKQGRRILLPD